MACCAKRKSGVRLTLPGRPCATWRAGTPKQGESRMSKMQDFEGQSLWLDNISREILVSGELAGLVEAGLKGLTSNPAIFEKAISSGNIYDAEIGRLKAEGSSPSRSTNSWP